MKNKPEGVISTVAAMLVLFTAMLDPRISIILAVVALVGLSLYSFSKKDSA